MGRAKFSLRDSQQVVVVKMVVLRWFRSIASNTPLQSFQPCASSRARRQLVRAGRVCVRLYPIAHIVRGKTFFVAASHRSA